ncbi:MarR family transcriptional regulator [Bacillus cytotoxicus]|uniref:MarR family transcriptional regulator n=1 Tax=Bacillus cereus group TaxID=86661 RepID=UPI00208F97AF|nr:MULTISPECIES: MarR family transcriptional regulator [Bacillus cereus group]MCU5713456.1 MarR family transcriptional regulator [Bacillus cereus]MDG1651754.1 MarR family transcriptional regulator [Bacillus pacificus]MDX5747211.1 MarR family transcriptional regulator [Bacillus cereus group sp. BfR-BA-02570]MDX5769678.1 MarR family transcriptional regulator [Bacillus cereus group sp. BfR-BA-02675]MEC3224802.1 MarR family transcriptional regulator [Bacillus thuringiensis]
MNGKVELQLVKAEKKAQHRENKIDNIFEQLQSGGFSEEDRGMLLQLLSKATGGEEYYIGKKKKPTDRVKFVQLIMDNVNYLTELEYLSSKEEAFLFKLAPYVEFKTNVIIQQIDKDNADTTTPASPTYLAERFKMARKNISLTMNGLLKKGILGVAESGMITEDGRACTSRTWFVNPNIMCCSPKDGIDKATQHIFRNSLRNFKVDDSKKKYKLPIYLF